MRRPAKLLRPALVTVLLVILAWHIRRDAEAALAYFRTHPALLTIPPAVGVAGGLLVWLFSGVRRGPVGLVLVTVWAAANLTVCLYVGSLLGLPAISLLVQTYSGGSTVREWLECHAAFSASLLGTAAVAFLLWWPWYRYGYRRVRSELDGMDDSSDSPTECSDDHD